jgi:hypothetical protein
VTFTGQTMEYTGSPAAEIDRDEAGEVWSGDSSGTEARGLAGIARDVRLMCKSLAIEAVSTSCIPHELTSAVRRTGV